MNTQKARSRRLLLVTSFGVVFVVLAWGLSLSGTPDYNRRMRLDRLRMDRLESLRSRVVEYHRREGVFPESLESLKADCCYGNSEVPRDPETEAPYEYRRLSGTEFEVCAIFSEPSPEPMLRSSDAYSSGLRAEHPAGRFCLHGAAPKAKSPA